LDERMRGSMRWGDVRTDERADVREDERADERENER
jgi:hypothetical protein